MPTRLPTRRSILAAAGGTAASLALVPRAFAPNAFAQAATAPAAPAAPPAGPFKLPPLPYSYDALEPSIDKTTMELHHDKHHAAYVNNLNTAAKTAPQIADVPLEKLLADLGSVPESVRTLVRNNGGGNANHTMFWQVMGPGGGGMPQGEVADAIARDLGGMEAMKTSFDTAGTKLFGSGWVFVTVGRDGKLALETRPNQDTPLMDGKRVLFGNDVWEHAYYLKYQNRRAEYLKAWWNTVNWGAIGQRYAAAKAGTLGV